MNKNWMLWAGLILILVVFILVWQFAPAIRVESAPECKKAGIGKNGRAAVAFPENEGR